jgi:hypothetical protein
MANIIKRRSQRLSRRRETLINKSYEIAKFCDVDVALFLRIRKTGQLIVYKSTDAETWPPSKEEIVSLLFWESNIYANGPAAMYLSTPREPASSRH